MTPFLFYYVPSHFPSLSFPLLSPLPSPPPIPLPPFSSPSPSPSSSPFPSRIDATSVSWVHYSWIWVELLPVQPVQGRPRLQRTWPRHWPNSVWCLTVLRDWISRYVCIVYTCNGKRREGEREGGIVGRLERNILRIKKKKYVRT